nr:hypothetical protein [Planctomycetota bacterium]
LCLVALPILIDREAKPGETNGPGGLKPWAAIDVEQGAKLSASKLWGWLEDDQRLEDGLIVIWRRSCEVCADHLRMLADTEQGERDLVLLELPKEFDDEKDVVERKPFGGYVQEVLLPDTVIWDVVPPVHIEVQGGIVTKLLKGMDVMK